MVKIKIFITGICGFIGTHLRQRLEKEGHNVIGLDNLSHNCIYAEPPEIIDSIANIEDYTDSIANSDFVLNLAADINVEKSILMPMHAIESNFVNTIKILNVCTKLNVPLIHWSTSEIYGDKNCKGYMNENHSTFPKSPYAAAKLAIDGLMHAYYHCYNSKVIIVRNFNLFGKYQSNDKFGAVIGIFADNIINNKPPEIFGDGTQKRDFMSVNDAIDFYMLIIKIAEKRKLWGQEFNIGMGKNITINELANKMIKLVGKNIKPAHGPARPGEVKEFLCDNSKAKKLGWKPDTNFDKLLKEFIDWKIEEKQNEINNIRCG